MEKVFFYDFPVGRMVVRSLGGAITQLEFARRCDTVVPIHDISETPVMEETKRQLELYFCGELREFSIPLLPRGTEFQVKVWEALQKIPYGTTASYKDIAVAIGSPKSCRAVGGANNKNPISIIIPCHRVIGADGKLVGYGGGLDIKEKLLHLEGII